MKFITFFFIFALSCIFAIMQTEAFSRVRREEETTSMDEIQKKLSETFNAFKKTAEEMTSNLDLKKLQEEFTSKLDKLSKSFSEFSSPVPDKTEVPTP